MDKKELTSDLFKPIKEKFISVVDEVTFNKEASFALQHLSRNSYLASADKSSILEAVLNVAQTGLTLNPVSKLAYLVPRFVRDKGVVCCLEPSYMGLVKLATDTGSVKSIYSHIIYHNDEFNYELGTNPDIIHKPLLGKDRGNMKGVYAVAVLQNGTKQIEVMTMDEIFEIRDKSESYKAYLLGKAKSCIWVSDESEMSRKTVIKRLCKYLPKTEMWDKLYNAIELDNSDYKISDNQINLIEQLLMSCTYSPEKIQFISNNLTTYSREQATNLIEDLKLNQLDPISSGNNYNQTDIKNKLLQIEKDNRK
jgi:recombination protein RecT